MFDPNTLLQTVMDQPMAETRPLVPIGEYVATVAEVKPEQFRIIESEKMKPGEGGSDMFGRRLVLDLVWEIDSAQYPALLQATKRTRNFVRQSIFIDVTPTSDLEAGKFAIAVGEDSNLQLGRLRKALGLNEKGMRFSFASLAGRVARITVTHRKDGENEYDQVSKVVPL